MKGRPLASGVSPVAEPLRVGMVGAGQIAWVHGPLIRAAPEAEIVGIADRDISKATALAQALGGVPVHAGLDALLAENEPDVLHVLVPPSLHAEVSLRAMEAGCHVLVEKPLALTTEEAHRLLEAAERFGVALRVDHNLLYDKLIRRVLRAVEEGAIGEVLSVHLDFAYDPRRNPGILEPGAEHHHWAYSLPGGPLQDLFPHPASLITRWLDEIEDVSALHANRGVLPEAWDDELQVLIRSGERFGSIHLTLSERPDAVVLTIGGTGGSLSADLYSNTLVVRKRRGLPRAVSRGLSGFSASRQQLSGAVRNILDLAARRLDKSGGIGPLIEEFYAELREGRAGPPTPGALATVRLMNEVWPPESPPASGSQRRVEVSVLQPTPSVLVTGATGFIGTHLLRRLRNEGWSVRALVRPDSPRAGRARVPGVEVRWADISDVAGVSEAAAGVDVVLHAASAVSGDWSDHRRSTIEGTGHVIRAALEHGVRRIVFLSSLAVYDLQGVRKGEVIMEDHPHHSEPARVGPYALAKIAAERALMEAHEKYGLPVTILRPGMVVGPYGSVFFPHFGYRIGGLLFLITAPRDLVLPLTYIENTVDAILAAASREEAVGQAFNVVDADEVSVEEYLHRFRQATGGVPPMIRLPRAVPYAVTAAYELAASLGLVRKGVTSRAQLKEKQAPVRFSGMKARQLLGWQQPVSLDDGLDRTFQWYRRAG